MKNFFIILLFLCISFLFSGCSNKKLWTGYYYSDIERMGDENTWKIQPGFKSLEDCRDWVSEVVNESDNYDYECGYNCIYDENLKMNVCEKTL